MHRAAPLRPLPFAARGGGLLLALVLGACATGEAARRIALESGFATRIVDGDRYRHVVFERAAGGARLWVFIEGDGLPFVSHGTRVATDPTPRSPLALELAVRTPGAVVYLGRPCYFGLARDRYCSPALWTEARYSNEVVASLAAAVRAELAAGGHREVVLVGYSGGGTLAVLLAPLLPEVRAVVTIAANLDVAAWAALHGYRPLAASLDPARIASRPGGAPVVHLAAGRDAVVPRALIVAYLAAHPGEAVGDFPRFDHVCCWVEAWPAILADLAPWLDGAAPLPVPGGSSPQRAFSRSTAASSGL